MLKRFCRVLLVSVLLLSLFSIVVRSPRASDDPALDDAGAKLATAFEAVAEAERRGGDVSKLVEELNEALALLERGEAEGDEAALREAEGVIARVIDRAPAIGRKGEAAARARMIQTGLVVGLVVVSAAMVWGYGPMLFWRLWTRSKRGWMVRACS